MTDDDIAQVVMAQNDYAFPQRSPRPADPLVNLLLAQIPVADISIVAAITSSRVSNVVLRT